MLKKKMRIKKPKKQKTTQNKPKSLQDVSSIDLFLPF